MTPANARIVPSTLENDIRELHKWLNEQPNRPVDRPALARVVYYARTANLMPLPKGANQMTTDKAITTELAKDALAVISVFAVVTATYWLYGLDFERGPELAGAFVVAVFFSLVATCARRGA